MSSTGGTCSTPGCDKIVEQPLACPKCVKMGLPPAYFCTQKCFVDNYKHHKKVHSLAKTILMAQGKGAQCTQADGQYDDGVTCAESASNETKQLLPNWAHNYNFTGSLRPALLSPKRAVTKNIPRPDYADESTGVSYSEQRDRANNTSIRVYTENELEGDCGLRHACAMGREVLDVAGKAVRVGTTTDELDRVVHEACMEREVYPSPLNYHNFPKSVCTSVNEVICHGIPDYRELQEGDIVNLDVTTFNKRGFHGDLNESFFVGKVDEKGQKLVQTSFECLANALALVKPGTLYRDLGSVIQKHASKNKCTVNRSYCGHGIGTLFHTAPTIPHYKKNRAKGVMKKGHVFTVEPMINAGTHGDYIWGDNWTAITQDGERSSQFEHTVLVTDTGCEILTARENEPVMTWNPALQQR